MFRFLFGWRNASKCKRLAKQAQCRLKLLKNKSFTIARQLRDDIAQLVQIGDEQRAFNRAEQLFKDENIAAVYELLDHFCEFIILHISYIRRQRELPNDINEAVSSLVFASARCGDIPELRNIRELFGERYGQRFLSTALNLLPGNLVNCQIKEKLSIISVSDDAKSKLVDEIARNHCLWPEVLALEYTSEFHKKVKESSNRERDRKAREADTISYLVSSSSLRAVESPDQDAEEKQGTSSQMDAYSEAELYKFTVTDLDIRESQETGTVYMACDRSKLHKPEIISEASRQENLTQTSDQTMNYPEDIEELETSLAKDQRVFRFRSQVHPRTENPGYSFDESSTEKSSSISSTRARKRSRRRSSASWENVKMNDMECFVYYNRPSNRYKQRKHQKHQSQESVKPCYIVYNVFTYPDQPWPGPNDGRNGKERIRKGSDCPGSRASSSNGATVMATPPFQRAKTMPARETVKERCREGFGRSSSCALRNIPNHVHPKLPDYDEITAKFVALRRERLQSKDHLSKIHRVPSLCNPVQT